MSSEVVYNVQQILEILDHRYPFLLVDKIIEFEDQERIVGVKNVTFNEPFFPGHFPNHPVMPGVLILEAMAQVGAVLAKESTDGVRPGHFVYLVGATDFKWKRQVVPGDTLVIEMTSVRRRRPLWVMEGKARVNGEIAVSGIISACEGMP